VSALPPYCLQLRDILMTTTLTLPSDRTTLALGHWLGRHLPAGTVLLLEGDLGSGKTTLTKGLGKGLGIQEEIDSPTFTLINEYDSGRLPLYHVDLYRLDPSDASRLFLESYWEGIEYPPGIVAIEWAERLPDGPPAPLKIHLAYNQADGRDAILTPTTSPQAELLEALTLDALLAHEI
jgi:tRNA threonylcarbamoyladenosine biosynthesis protein TsaE